MVIALFLNVKPQFGFIGRIFMQTLSYYDVVNFNCLPVRSDRILTN